VSSAWQFFAISQMKRLVLATLLLAPFIGRAATDTNNVGRVDETKTILPVNRVLTPAGRQMEFPGIRPQVAALSPDGALLVTSGGHDIIVIDPTTAKVIQNVPLPRSGKGEAADVVSEEILKPDTSARASYTGLAFSPDGSRLFLSDVNGSVKAFSVSKEHKITGRGSFSLPPAKAPRRDNEIPAGLAMSRDGNRLYVAGNLSNRLLELDSRSGKVLRTFKVGALPYDVVVSGGKLYVSNWGGRRPEAGSVTGPAGRGTKVRVDPVRFIANEGSVSVIDATSGNLSKEIMVGVHASAMVLSPSGRYLCVANAGSDTISVIDVRKDEVVETISLRWHANDIFGAGPNAMAFGSSDVLYVCNGSQNALAAVSFRPGKSKLLGLIPTGWYPGAIVHDSKRSELYVANIRGTLASKQAKYNSHDHVGTFSLIPVPRKKELAKYTKTVLENYRDTVMQEALLPARPNRSPQPIPERVGEPSVFKHVVYIIKENRTYDQVLGDVKAGNGNADLCIFGERVTPNQHKMVRDFVLLDNTYCSGILSADGHQWTDTAFTTDYMEKSFAGFPRSYTHGMTPDGVDAMVYSPGGFIWDNVLAHGKTFRDYGEYTIGFAEWKNPKGRKTPRFADYYDDFIKQKGEIVYGCEPGVESLRPHMMTNTIGWNLRVPDVFRAAQFIKELHEFEARGDIPNLSIICLPNDHTSGTRAGTASPAAMVADNDLAFGQIVEAISHGPFWKDTCVFAVEDDPQAGWDHVSGYRTTAYVVSPYTKRNTVVSVNYNQTSLMRTIELMLGLPPMNQMDASATPMFACFTNAPDFTPYTVTTNLVPLNELNPEVKAIRDSVQKKFAIASNKLPLEVIDQCPEDLFNRILWHAAKGKEPYPLWAITVVKEDDDE
jgi:YVTN family beta-propeller protein